MSHVTYYPEETVHPIRLRIYEESMLLTISQAEDIRNELNNAIEQALADKLEREEEE